ncbi:class I SAM-dependent methyltransferase [Streptomyces sp. GESEQ-35]|uniref:class I SAM-dependent DNA methyltransferase n=1 Tax=Streptomyces sp. GESEQ-35 TaxID=2812657 RepID=UPI0027E34797|nr:class I SAM-dependent methyltransferase [Streptomyces sp. GESEQ-35]
MTTPDIRTGNGYADGIARVYDLVHQGKGKDYRREAADLAALITSRAPGARSLLDVACGTGLHLQHLTPLFDRVEGLELSADMREIALRRNPGATVHLGDMRAFALDTRYAAVICMFSSIGHMSDQTELDTALARFAAHLEPGGVVVVEPWWFPATFTPGFVGASIVEAEGRTISRVSHSRLEGDATAIEVHYLIAEPGHAIEHLSENHLITLFERSAYELAFERAGLDVEFQRGGPSGRGLFIGVRQS